MVGDSKDRSLILDLPSEIRQVILREVFVKFPRTQDSIGSAEHRRSPAWLLPQLCENSPALRVCRKFYEEGIPLLYGSNVLNTGFLIDGNFSLFSVFCTSRLQRTIWFGRFRPPFGEHGLVTFRQIIRQNWSFVQHVHLDSHLAQRFFTKVALRWILTKDDSVMDIATRLVNRPSSLYRILSLPNLRSLSILQETPGHLLGGPLGEIGWRRQWETEFDFPNLPQSGSRKSILDTALRILATGISNSPDFISICLAAIMGRHEAKKDKFKLLKAFVVPTDLPSLEAKQQKETEIVMTKGRFLSPCWWREYKLPIPEEVLGNTKTLLRQQHIGKIALDKKVIMEILDLIDKEKLWWTV